MKFELLLNLKFSPKELLHQEENQNTTGNI